MLALCVYSLSRSPRHCFLSIFRQETAEVFSGSYDGTIKMWNAEDKAYFDTYSGPQAEILTIDALRRERVLSVGRDKIMHLFKVLEKTRLIFRAPAPNLECCCFISNDEFLSGSDNGNLACSWVSSVVVCRRSNLAASGAGNGCVRLWGVESESRALRPLYELPLHGFVNSLAFAKSGRFLIAGVVHEPRLEKWGYLKSAQNGVAIHPLRLS